MSSRAMVGRLVAGSLLFVSHAALCAEIEEIVVVAQKRTESIQDVPISVVAISGLEIEERGLNDLQELARFVPNVDVPRSNNLRNAMVRIRGIGTSGSNPGIESSVGTFLDGLYMPTSAMAMGDLIDIQSVEILRGPQGTLYGRNTPVGAVNITTRKPTRELESAWRLGAGDYGARWINGFIGGGISDRVAGRVSAYYRNLDGYEDNEYLDEDANGSEERGVRGRLLFEPSDSLEVNLAAFWSSSERNCCVAEFIDPQGPLGIATPGFLEASADLGYPFQNFDGDDHDLYADDEGDEEVDYTGASVQFDWTLANELVLTAITGYQDWEHDVVLAADSLPQPVLNVHQNQHNKLASQEVRLMSPAGKRSEFIAGLFLQRQDTEYNTRTALDEGANRVFPFPPAICAAPCMFALEPDAAFQEFEQQTISVALFGNFTFHVSDSWDVTAGLRWSRDEKENTLNYFNAPGSQVPFTRIFQENRIGDVERTDENVTWLLNSRYHFNRDVMAFASVATGFKSGGFNATRVPPGTPIEFEEEHSISYEAGIKSMWFDRSLQLNATLYWTVLEDFQESSFNQTAGTGFIVTNAGERASKGIEAELVARPLDGLQLDAAIAYLDAEYTEFDNAQCGGGEIPDNPQGTCDRSDDVPAFAPKWKYVVGAEYLRSLGRSDLEWRVRANYAWVDDQNLIRVTIDPPGDQGSYGLLDVSAAIGSIDGRWEARVYVDNVMDEDYFIQANATPGGGLMSAGGVSGAGGYVGWYGPPRNMGMQLTWRP